MSRTVTAISGELLFRQVRASRSGLGYLIIKHGLTVVEPPIARAKKPSGKPKYVMTDPEELLEIIQYDPGALRNMLFLLSEIDKVCPPGIEVEYDNTKSFCIGQIPFPVSPAEPQRAYLGGKSSLFSIELEAKRGDFGAAEVYMYDTKDSLKDTIEYHETQIKQSPNVFSLLGKVWFIKFKNEEWGLYPDQEKYRYIANVLSLCDGSPKPYDTEYSIYNTDLCAKVKGESTGDNPVEAGTALKELSEADLSEDDLSKDDLSKSDLSDTLSVEELKSFKKQGYDLLEQLGDARKGGNQDRIKKSEENIHSYQLYLFNEYGIKTGISKDEKKLSFKVHYRPGSEIEKLRQVVKNQINNAIKNFDRMPKFKSHLQRSLHTGVRKTVYSPEQPLGWTVSA